MKHLGGLAAALSLLSAMVAVVGCYSTCPGGHDPSANPVGEACHDGSDCQVECVCRARDADEGDDGDGVVVGDCVGGTCADADKVCRDACGTDDWTGEYCEVAE
jgi:hypothetical protein